MNRSISIPPAVLSKTRKTLFLSLFFAMLIPLFCFAQSNTGDGSIDVSSLSALKFRMVGPSRGGRVTAVAGHRSEPHVFYMGATGGGVWKTTDAGASWDPISDGYFSTGSIGSIDVADSNPSVVYVGTGSDGIRSNVILGKGVYKSVDAGKTWSFSGLPNAGQIGAVVVHPTNPEVVYVAALGSPFGPNPDRGVYKSVDGGATWSHLLFVSEKTGAVDLELNPANPDIIYAALWTAERKPWTIISGDAVENGIYVSKDGGATWDKKTTGLPAGLTGKIDFAVSPADPSRVYALVEAVPEEEGLYRSNDYGETWYLVNNTGSLMRRPFYYTNVDAEPGNADVVYVNNEGFFKSTDAGVSFQRMSTPHGDNHDMWINPDDPEIFVQSNDGGANVTLNGGRTWSTQENQPTAELYQVHADDRFPYWLYAGQQDNSTIAVPSNPVGTRAGGPSAFWEAIGGCETGPAVPKPGNANIVYSNCKGRFGRYNRETGQEQAYYVGAVNLYGRNPAELPHRFQRVVPIAVSPHNPNVVYHGSQFVHRTLDEGKTWETISPDLTAFRPDRQVISGGPITRDITGEEHYSTLYAIVESPLEKGVIWAGSNDGPVHVTRDDGKTWTNVTPPGMPAEGRIQTLDVSHHSPGKAYFAGYRTLLNDFAPYIYRTTDYGKTWTRLTTGSNGIPADHPTRVIREDPHVEGLLYAGTEFGLFISFDDGKTWSSFQQNVPATPVTDMKIVENNLVISTMGRSFWILDNLSPLHQIKRTRTLADVHLFDPEDALRVSYFSGRGSAADPEYSRAGAVVDYFLRNRGQVPLMLEILDESGSVIRTVKGADPTPETSSEQGMRGPVRPSRPGALTANDGLNRFVWDLRHEGEGGNGRGPAALPGRYTARLTSGEISLEHTLLLQMDPRVEADGVTVDDLKAQFDFNTKASSLLSSATRLAASVDSLRNTLATPASASGAIVSPDKKELDRIFDGLVTDDRDSYPPPMLVSQIGYLLSMTSSADQRPGKDAYVRFEQLSDELSLWQSAFDVIRNKLNN